MTSATPPRVEAVQIVVTRPTVPDHRTLAHLREAEKRDLENAVYLVKLRLETVPQPSSLAWALYLRNERVPQCWAYKHGIFFKVFDPQFLERRDGHELRFSLNGSDFVDTGHRLQWSASRSAKTAHPAAPLPTQDEALQD